MAVVDDGSPRVGRAGRLHSAGSQARQAGLVLLVTGLLLGLVTLGQWWDERDLLDLDALERAQGRVVEVDEARRKGQDHLVVAYPVDAAAGLRAARIPTDLDAASGATVEVAYDPDDPGRVRTVEGWSAFPGPFRTLAPLALLAGLVLTVSGYVSRARGSRWEQDGQAQPGRVDRLGRRVVVASRAVVWVLLLLVAVVVGLGVSDPIDQGTGPPALWLVGGALAGALVLVPVLLWGGGRDGVWSTPTHLVARRRRSLRRWRWDEVRELALVLEQTRAQAVAARLADAPEAWVTLARPAVGPLVAHRNAARLRAAAAEQGVPYTEGLSEYELSDGMMGPLARLTAGPARRR